MKKCRLCGSEMDCRGLKCKSCLLAERRSRVGVASTIYNAQVASSIKRGHFTPEYSKGELYEWMLDQDNFEALYERWVASGYETPLKPSCDRLDETKGYSFGNMRLITAGENIEGWREKGKGAVKRVYCYSFKGDFVKKYESITAAANEMGCHCKTITYLCKQEHLEYRWGCFWSFRFVKNIADKKFMWKPAKEVKEVKPVVKKRKEPPIVPMSHEERKERLTALRHWMG